MGTHGLLNTFPPQRFAAWAAAELCLHRTTLTQWLNQAADTLGLDLTTATVRAELHLAIEIIAVPTDVPTALPRRGGRTYRAP
ncbi:helix-turn-helix domain-containing protein [Streptomyces olivaceus]|uniref:helix-turn-helix domain-containing protein n=1 Tax=Streptomyces olivaceus TaxID=47716 RepID=UPI0022EDAC12|nr:helix-turn-helix domain-containing protein [Streptomyces olivaceus]GHI98008.1 hypothetical protein TPA0905_74790 [Streptomyces olivaceus]